MAATATTTPALPLYILGTAHALAQHYHPPWTLPLLQLELLKYGTSSSFVVTQVRIFLPILVTKSLASSN